MPVPLPSPTLPAAVLLLVASPSRSPTLAPERAPYQAALPASTAARLVPTATMPVPWSRLRRLHRQDPHSAAGRAAAAAGPIPAVSSETARPPSRRLLTPYLLLLRLRPAHLRLLSR